MRCLIIVAIITLTATSALAVEVVDTGYDRLLSDVQASLPLTGRPICDCSQLSEYRLQAQPAQANYSLVPVEGQPFRMAIRAKVVSRTFKAYDVQILTPPTTQPVKKGDWVLAAFSVRCIDAADDTGLFDARIQAGPPTFAGVDATDELCGRQWKRIYLHGQATQDMAAGLCDIALHLGTQAQTLEFGGFVLMNLGPSVPVAKLPFTPITYAGQEDDAPWRKAAADRIEKIRKGDVRVSVVDKADHAVSAAAVHMQMTRHAYGFGTFLECQAMFAPGDDAQKLRDWTLKLFNRATTPIYWSQWGWAHPPTRNLYLQCAKWAADNKLATRGHCIIYPGFNFMPDGIRDLAKDPPALRKRLLEQVVEVTDATRAFNFCEYDVTNELRDLPEIHRLLGKDAVAEWYKVAREHVNPASRLALNENSILTHGGVVAEQQDGYAQWIQYLMDQHVGPDVIGMQGHFGHAVTAPDRVLGILDRFARFGKPIQITEFDLVTPDEAGQARYLRDFLTVVFSHPSTEAFTMWGFWEGRMWQSGGAMVRKDWSLKPSGVAWMDLLFKQWWTDVTLTSANDGSCATRAFLGDYQITATLNGKSKTIKATLDKPDQQITVVLEQ